MAKLATEIPEGLTFIKHKDFANSSTNFEMKDWSFGSCVWVTLSLTFVWIHYIEIISL